eukprot:COSAG02_NODE_122_length_35306_cov_98.280967_21_plen_40_part_00
MSLRGVVAELCVGLNSKPHFVPVARQASVINAVEIPART